MSPGVRKTLVPGTDRINVTFIVPLNTHVLPDQRIPVSQFPATYGFSTARSVFLTNTWNTMGQAVSDEDHDNHIRLITMTQHPGVS